MTTSSSGRSIAVTGASGLIGTSLSRALRARGDTVIPISRHKLAGGIQWEPASGRLDGRQLEGIDAVVHLAGESIAGGRWTAARKLRLQNSRVAPTRLLAETLASLSHPPSALISVSAVGIYGDRGDEVLSEESSLGNDFLATLARAWEGAAAPAGEVGIRVVHPRWGVVLAAGGGALARMLPPFRLGLGGPVGGGGQWLPWIGIDDVVGIIDYLIEHPEVNGPVNGVGPELVTNAQFGSALGRVLHRPALIPLPAIALKLAFGEMAEATLLASQRVVPSRLTDAGYQFRHPTLERALRAVLG